MNFLAHPPAAQGTSGWGSTSTPSRCKSRYAAQQLGPQGGRRYFSEADYARKSLARETGAQAFFPGPAELKGVYGPTATELASQYSIGYVPANGRTDGRFRRVIVQVVTRPELRPRTRLGYTADGLTFAGHPSQVLHPR